MADPYVEVRVTPDLHFQAKIIDAGAPTYVNVGGVEWHRGVGRRYESLIMRKIQGILTRLTTEYAKL